MRFALAATLLALSLSACGQSPLLNHDDASDVKPVAPPESDFARGECQLAFPKQNLCGNITWVSGPQVNKASAFRLQFKDQTTGAAKEPDADVEVHLWMPEMGHGSSPVTIKHAEAADASAVVGSYDVTNVFFIMNGTWELHVHLEQNGATLEEAKTTVKL